jgi:hypothetical protein
MASTTRKIVQPGYFYDWFEIQTFSQVYTYRIKETRVGKQCICLSEKEYLDVEVLVND